MSDQHSRTLNPRATANRLLILQLLADNSGPLSQSELMMDGRSKSSAVTRAMHRAGWITREFRDGDWWFDATFDGLEVLERHRFEEDRAA